MTKFKTLRLLASLVQACVLSLAILGAPALAAKNPASKGQVTDISPQLDNKAPIRITSDRMEADQQARTIAFEGHVLVRQSDLTITSNRLKVTMAQETKGGKAVAQKHAIGAADPAQRIDYIDFTGDVKVTQQDRVATAQEAIFMQKERKILLKGSPVVTKGQDRIQGKLITIYLKDNRCVVEGGQGAQVRAVLFPEKKE